VPHTNLLAPVSQRILLGMLDADEECTRACRSLQTLIQQGLRRMKTTNAFYNCPTLLVQQVPLATPYLKSKSIGTYHEY